jgi:precorrin-6B methylase 2
MSGALTHFEWKGRAGPFALAVGAGVFTPTLTSRALADALEVHSHDTVVDVGCGSGVLALTAARLGAGRVYGVDTSRHAVEAARRNAEALGLSGTCEFRHGDLLQPLHGVEATVVVGDVSGVPNEIAAASGWFDGVSPGGPTGAELPIRLLESIGDVLVPGGRLYLPTGSLQDEHAILETARRVFDGRVRLLRQLEVPLPAPLAASTALECAVRDGIVSLRQRGSRLLWQIRIWRCDLPLQSGSSSPSPRKNRA